jgi:hypothetical protein
MTVKSSQKKIDMVRAGLPVECRWHGIHADWRIHSGGCVQCRLCSNAQAKIFRHRNHLRYLATWARRRDYLSEITGEFLADLLIKQDGRCALTGVVFDRDNTPSLDRKDSSGRYTRDNVQLVLVEVNRMKSNFDQFSFVALCDRIATWQEPIYGLSGC